MPRRRRVRGPGRVHHIISRVLNGEFRIGPVERADYLRRVPRALEFFDWVLLAWAIMSNHVHWAKFAGLAPMSVFFESLHSGFGWRTNATQKRSGPLFTGRPRDWFVRPTAVASTIAYIHNNPVRAGVVTSPELSHWTSHRMYLGLEPAPPWLDVEFGLAICGFDATRSGREAFHEFVVSEMQAPRDKRLADTTLVAQQGSIRHALNAPVEIGSVTLDDSDRSESSIMAPSAAVLRPRWPGDIEEVVRIVALETGIPVETIRSRDRARSVAAARRLAIQLGRSELGFSLTEIAAAVGMSPGAANNLIRRYTGDREQLVLRAVELAGRAWRR